MHVDEVMNIPGKLGMVSFKELEANNIKYVRNGENKELREYVKKKFTIEFDQFYLNESGSGQYIVVMDDRR